MSLWHDLRSPLTGIVGPAALIQATTSDPQARDHAGLILESADRLADRINSVEADARSAAEHAGARRSTVDDTAAAIERRLHEVTVGRAGPPAAIALAAQLVALAWSEGRCRSIASLDLGAAPPTDLAAPTDDRHLRLARDALSLCGFRTGLSPSGDIVVEVPSD